MSLFLKGESWLQYLRQQLAWGRAARIVRILRTPYRALLRDERLNFRQACFSIPAFKTVSEDSEWKVMEADGMHFFWPREYGEAGLRGLYYEAFAPPDCNPHAFEVEDLCVRPGDWVVDAGACEGFFAYCALQRGANVLMVEPVPKLAEALSHTFEEEVDAGKAIVLRAAIGDRVGEMKLTVPERRVYAASIGRTGGSTVTVYTLDALVATGLVPTIDFVKMDIENAEIAAVRGGTKLLRSQMPKLSIAVYHEFLNARIIQTMVLETQPRYRVDFRGIFVRRGFGPPRPYMLHARV